MDTLITYNANSYSELVFATNKLGHKCMDLRKGFYSYYSALR